VRLGLARREQSGQVQVIPRDRLIVRHLGRFLVANRAGIEQPTSAPTRKVTAAGLGGLLGALPAPLLALLDTITLPEPAIGALSAALTLLGALSAAYLTRERGSEA
jgi:hypothetical protein